jgi:hypothetical protein
VTSRGAVCAFVSMALRGASCRLTLKVAHGDLPDLSNEIPRRRKHLQR